MERNVSMVLFLNSEWEEFIFLLGNFPHRVRDAGWERSWQAPFPNGGDLGGDPAPVTSPRAAFLTPSAQGRRQHVGLRRVWDASAAAGTLSPVAAMRIAPAPLSCP